MNLTESFLFIRIAPLLATTLLALFIPTDSRAQTCSIDSGLKQRPVVMLFTSEGCSSCPPADKWATSLMRTSQLKPVVLGFHVTYWDYIGWKDRFASANYTQLQKRVSSAVGLNTIYTPQIMLQGKEYRNWGGWSGNRGDADLLPVAIKDAAARVQMQLTQVSPTNLKIALSVDRLTANSATGDWEALVALTEDKLDSRVSAGENRGEHLKHDGVVRWLSASYPISKTVFTQDVDVAVPTDAKRNDLTVAAVVMNRKTGEVIQGVSGKMCGI
jgi:hypothetical protein